MAVLLGSAIALALTGCSDRDTGLAQKLARAEAAAQRAEAAASRAEAAARRVPPRAPEPVAEEQSDNREPPPGAPTVDPTPTN